MDDFFRRIYYLLNRRRLERELQNDIDVHREMLSPDSRKDFGNAALARERSREAWGWGWLDRLAQDFRFGARLLRKSPGLVLTAVTVLALGIGVNVTAFNLMDVMFFKPLRVRDPLSLVRFTLDSPTSSSTEVPYPAAMFYGKNSRALSAVLAQASTHLTLTEKTNQEVTAGLVSANYFSELGASAGYGRLFDPRTDDAPDASPVVVLGYKFWQGHFAGDASVVNQVVRLNQHPATVIGVLPFDFIGLDAEHGEKDDVWVMIPQLPYFVPETKMVTSFDLNDSAVHMSARLRAGVSRKAAAAALQPLSQELVRQHPDVLPKDLTLLAYPGGYAAHLGPGDGDFLAISGLFGTLVLLILAASCGNLGNLLLGHALTREREISIRMALGATRRRIVRQLMTENLLLAFLGSAGGLLLCRWITRPLTVWLGGPSHLDVTPDWRTILFAFAMGGFACILFGLSPARQAAAPAKRKSRTRTAFMATQITASCVLLVLSGLLVRALNRASNVDPGFDYARIITVDPQLYAHGYTPARSVEYMQELRTRLEQLPGVDSAALAAVTPMGNHVRMMRPEGEIKVNIHLNDISRNYFQAMGIPLLRGRDFTPQDQYVVIVSESAARNLWPGKDPMRQTWKHGDRQLAVIGVAGNARSTGLRNGDDAQIYTPIAADSTATATMLVHTSQAPEGALANVSAVARETDPALSPNVRLLKATLAEKLSDSQKIASVVGGMGTLALALAIVGLYGVVAYTVSQKTKEIGIRIALGATSAGIVRTMISSFVLPLSIALGAGLALAALLSGILRQYLYGLSNFDPFSYLAAIALLAIVGGVAALLPARRALRVDPMEALRCE
ncbi:MAG TPA: ABC transporter permease [Candidatus Angelobacter sp.]|nr:ABC transporter permease [Candidatus Angelobacter sp.]